MRKVPVKGSRAIRPDGTQTDARPGDGLGRRWNIGSSGDDIWSDQPPKGFRPLQATDQELAAYGLLPRPKDAVALAEWQKMYANYVAPDPDTPTDACVQGADNWFVGISDIWAGAVNNGAPPEGYWQVQAGFKQTAFDAVCPGTSAYSTWAGIGGKYGPALAQTGTDTVFGGSLNQIRTWYEVISKVTGYHSNEVGFINGHAPQPGDNIYASVNWHNAAPPYLEFHVIGPGWDDHVAAAAFHTEPAINFYEPTSAEYISEQVSDPNGGAYYLRKPHLNNTWFFWAKADQRDMEAFQRFGLDQSIDNNGYNQRIESYPPNPGWTGSENYFDQWYSCW